MKNSLAEKKMKCCDRIVETKGHKIYLAKAKRPSKLRQLIITERKKQKKLQHEIKKKEPVIDVYELNIGSLKIVPDPDLDLDYGKTLKGLNLIGNEYRDPINDSLVDEIVENRKDISQRLENLLINANDEINVIEDDLRHDIANIEINEVNIQEGILNDVQRTLNLNGDIFQNPAFRTFRDNSNNLRYSKKFRE